MQFEQWCWKNQNQLLINTSMIMYFNKFPRTVEQTIDINRTANLGNDVPQIEKYIDIKTRIIIWYKNFNQDVYIVCVQFLCITLTAQSRCTTCLQFKNACVLAMLVQQNLFYSGNRIDFFDRTQILNILRIYEAYHDFQ